MNNPMLSNLNRSLIAQKTTPFKNMFNTLKNAGNPQMMFNQMLSQNPQMKQVMDYVNQNGGNPKEAFYKLAQEKGINPDDILIQFR